MSARARLRALPDRPPWREGDHVATRVPLDGVDAWGDTVLLPRGTVIRVDAVGLLGKGWAIDGFVVAMDEDVYANVEWDHFSKPFAPAGWLAVRVARVRGWFWRYRGGS